ncbi:hypothetical protein AAVH_39652, partial [Aphelenchoides avenae]
LPRRTNAFPQRADSRDPWRSLSRSSSPSKAATSVRRTSKPAKRKLPRLRQKTRSSWRTSATRMRTVNALWKTTRAYVSSFKRREPRSRQMAPARRRRIS